MKKIVLALLDHFESYLCQFLLVFFVVVILLQIVLRQINMSLPWTEEIARFAFIWFILFGACYATRLCALNRVTLQFSRAPKWVGNLFLFIGDIIWLCFSLIMAWEGYIAVDRTSVVEGKSVDLGGGRVIQNPPVRNVFLLRVPPSTSWSSRTQPRPWTGIWAWFTLSSP